MLFCSIDTQVAGRKYAQLRKDKGLLGLPSVVFLDAAGTVLVAVPHDQRTVAGFRAGLQRAQAYVDARAQAAEGHPPAMAQFLQLQLEERQLSLAEATARRAALTAAQPVDSSVDSPVASLAPEVLATIDTLLLDLQVAEAVRAHGQDDRHTLGPRFLRMLREGPRPSPRVTRGFWFAILEWAQRERDAPAFREGLEGMRRALLVTNPGEPWVETLLQRYEAELAALERIPDSNRDRTLRRDR